MSNIQLPRFLIAAVLLVVLACNLPRSIQSNSQGNSETPANDSDQGTSPTDTPTETPIPFTFTPEFTATPEFTPTPTIPIVSVSENTNCRTGPGTQYDLISALPVGQTAEVVGKNTATNYWIIKTPGGMGNCWLWGQYATVSGNTANLPEYPVPPTPTPSIPAAAQDFNANVSCTTVMNPFIHNNVTVNLTWTDASNNEDGFRIHRNGNLLVTLSADTTNYTDNTTLPAIWVLGDPPPSITYEIRAFNATGSSNKTSITVKCP